MIDRDGHQAEEAATAVLHKAGWEVLNLNRAIAGNFPVIDLVACKGATRLLIQVRGTTNDHGSYTTRPVDARRAKCFAEWLGHPALYAFVRLTASKATIRFATASQVAALAEAEETAYKGINRYHVTIDDFDVDVHRIAELLDSPSGPTRPRGGESGREAA